MEIRRSTYEILQDVVNSMSKTITGKTGADWIDNMNGTFTLFTCSTLWAKVGENVTISGTDYKIKSVANNQSITIEASAAPVATTATVVTPKFWHGTIMFTDLELNMTPNAADKFPMIFLHEPTTEFHNYNELENEGMMSDCQLYFMTESDFTNWTNAQHYQYAVSPMRNMCNEFVSKLLSYRGTMQEPLPEGVIEDRVKWGKATAVGNFPKLITDDLTGTSLKISPHFYKEVVCCK